MPRRSLLFTPGDRPEMLRKAPRTGADVLIFDLEDAVPPGRRAAARDAIVECLSDPSFSPDAEVCVRINPGDPGAEDLSQLTQAERTPDAIMLPKASRADDVEAANRRVHDQLGVRLPLLVLLERAEAIERAPEIARAEATDALVFGAEDLSADLGATVTPGLETLSAARQRVVLAAALGGVDPIDTPFTKIEDTDGLREAAATARELGYVGKLAIHPDQVAPIEAAFTPSTDEIEWATRILDAGTADPDGVYVVDGEMVDAPIRRRAERVLRQADRSEDD